VYYHRADSSGIGFNRTATGSGAILQYAKPIQEKWGDPQKVPLSLLLWFHHVKWDSMLPTGRTLWDELCFRYYEGSQKVVQMQQHWASVKAFIDPQIYTSVRQLLQIQEEEAIWWREACLLYFQGFSKKQIPALYTPPQKSLNYYKSLRFPYAPGN
jgi:alpha-glucuronidase